jgi:hypothetical protein
MDDVIAGALACIAENEAVRPLCPRCVAREVNRHGDFCTRCEQARQAGNSNAPPSTEPIRSAAARSRSGRACA